MSDFIIKSNNEACYIAYDSYIKNTVMEQLILFQKMQEIGAKPTGTTIEVEDKEGFRHVAHEYKLSMNLTIEKVKEHLNV